MHSVLLIAEQMEEDIDCRLSKKFGGKFVRKISEKARAWEKVLLIKGNAALNWTETKGLPIPRSKAGLYANAAATGAFGIAVPGLGILLPLSYVLYKRGADMNSDQALVQTAI